jgi:hypothetical protein
LASDLHEIQIRRDLHHLLDEGIQIITV